jgi:hypothetical protein
MKVPWLSKRKIAMIAEAVSADYGEMTGSSATPPIPVEDIIERGLKVRIGFIDLNRKLGLDDVLGATFVESRLICVDESLLDDEIDGRLCFTFAHEAGHWVLHRRYIRSDVRAEFSGRSIFCRAKDAREPIEWQADYFASCLLMPEADVKCAFHSVYGAEPLRLVRVESSFCGPFCFDPCVANWHLIAESVIRAGGFSNVSKQAMIIRLQELGLVHNQTRAPLTWHAFPAVADGI